MWQSLCFCCGDMTEIVEGGEINQVKTAMRVIATASDGCGHARIILLALRVEINKKDGFEQSLLRTISTLLVAALESSTLLRHRSRFRSPQVLRRL